jgi:hypothetical protein
MTTPEEIACIAEWQCLEVFDVSIAAECTAYTLDIQVPFLVFCHVEQRYMLAQFTWASLQAVKRETNYPVLRGQRNCAPDSPVCAVTGNL